MIHALSCVEAAQNEYSTAYLRPMMGGQEEEDTMWKGRSSLSSSSESRKPIDTHTSKPKDDIATNALVQLLCYGPYHDHAS